MDEAGGRPALGLLLKTRSVNAVSGRRCRYAMKRRASARDPRSGVTWRARELDPVDPVDPVDPGAGGATRLGVRSRFALRPHRLSLRLLRNVGERGKGYNDPGSGDGMHQGIQTNGRHISAAVSMPQDKSQETGRPTMAPPEG